MAVSAMYVRKYFKDEIMETVGVIVESLVQEEIKMLNNTKWMDEWTRLDNLL